MDICVWSTQITLSPTNCIMLLFLLFFMTRKTKLLHQIFNMVWPHWMECIGISIDILMLDIHKKISSKNVIFFGRNHFPWQMTKMFGACINLSCQGSHNWWEIICTSMEIRKCYNRYIPPKPSIMHKHNWCFLSRWFLDFLVCMSIAWEYA